MRVDRQRPIQLRLLGEFGIIVAGGDRTPLVSYSKPKLLLALLALAEGRAYSRTELSEMLWPDRPGQARANLRHSIFVLRQLLAPVPEALACDTVKVALNLDLLEVDALALSGAPGYEGLTLEERLAYDRGDFLQYVVPPDSPAFHAWRTKWQGRIVQASRGLWRRRIGGLADRGGLDQALAAARSWVQLHPGEEGAHQSLILLHRDTGDRQAALNAYRECCLNMAEYYDAEPSAETRALLHEHLPAAGAEAMQAGEPKGRPLATLAVILSPEEGNPDPAQALRTLESLHGRVAGMGRAQGRSVCTSADGGLFIMFGYPALCERPAEAAARLACEIRAACGAAGVQLGMGIHADVTPDHPIESPACSMLISQQAMRLAYQAQHREVLLTAGTRRRLGNRFVVREDTSRTHSVYVLDRLAESAAVRRMFGRTPEFDCLVRRWKGITVGTPPGATLVRGEPGVGKSLLIDVFAEYTRRTGAIVVALRCEEGRSHVPLYAPREYLIRHLALECGVAAAELAQDPIRCIEAVNLWGERLGLAAPLREALSGLLGLDERAYGDTAGGSPLLSPDAAEALEILLMAREKPGQPLLLVWEDLHWADPLTLDFLAYLLARRQADPILILLSARSEFATPLGALELELRPLAPRAIAELVGQRVKGAQLPLALRRQIVAKSEGIPLFAEEMIRQGGKRGEPGVTPLIEDLVAVQLARLAPALRDQARRLAVAGDLDGPAHQAVDGLVAASTLPAATGGAAQSLPILFRRLMGREAVYRRIEPHRRRQEHDAAARRLIDLRARRRGGDAAAIARHLEAADNREATVWWRESAWEAFDRADFNAAAAMAAHAAERADKTTNPGAFGSETLSAAPPAVNVSGEDAGLAFLQAWDRWADALAEQPLAESRRHVGLLRRHETAGEPSLAAWSRLACGCTALFMGRLGTAERLLDGAAHRFAEAADRARRDVRSRPVRGKGAAAALQGWAMTLRGHVDAGLQRARLGLAWAEDSGSAPARALCLGVVGDIHRLRGEPVAARQVAHALGETAGRHSLYFWSRIARGLLAWSGVEPDGACPVPAADLDDTPAGFAPVEPLLDMYAARAGLEARDMERAAAALRRAATFMDRCGSALLRPEFYCLQGDLYAGQRRLHDAAACWRKATEEGRRIGAYLHVHQAARRLEK